MLLCHGFPQQRIGWECSATTAGDIVRYSYSGCRHAHARRKEGRQGVTSDFRLCLLGRPRFLDTSGNPLPMAAKLYPLVALLALSGSDGIVGRARAAALLWPDSERRGRGNLRQLLTRKRDIEKRLGIKLLNAGPADLRLILVNVSVDLIELADLLRDESTDSISRLGRLYVGDLLDGD